MNVDYQNLSNPSWIDNAIVYQIFPDRFKRSKKSMESSNLDLMNWSEPSCLQGFRGGDLYGVIEKLDYLRDIGINCIYLNPIFSSAANHRYHTYDYFQVDPILGGNKAFDLLIEEVHKREMFIVLDGVFNHCGRGFWAFHHIAENGTKSPYKNWFNLHNTPFNPYPKENEKCGYDSWWNDPALPKFNFNNLDVENYLLSVGEYWVKKGIDGWRLDVAKEIPFTFWDRFNYQMKKINSEVWVIGEIWGDARKWLDKQYFDGVMNYRIGWSTLSWVSDFKLSSSYKNPLYPLKNISSKKYIEIINLTHSWYSDKNDKCNLNLLDSHDVPRALNSLNNDENSLKLALFLMFLNKGVPCIYYGTEVGLSGGQEPNCRESFPWNKNYKIDIRKFLKDLISFRKNYISFINHGIKWSSIEDDVLCGSFQKKDLRKTNQKKDMIIYLNRSRKNKFLIPKNKYKIVFESENIDTFQGLLIPQSFVCFKDE